MEKGLKGSGKKKIWYALIFIVAIVVCLLHIPQEAKAGIGTLLVIAFCALLSMPDPPTTTNNKLKS